MPRRNRRRGRRMRKSTTSQHLWHQAAFCIVNTTGDYPVTIEQLGINTDRICKVKKIVVTFNAAKNVGQVMTFTVSPPDAPSDAPARSSPRLITKVQQTVSLTVPVSSDFGYYDQKAEVLHFSLTTGWSSASASIATFYNVRVLVEYRWQKEHRVDAFQLGTDALSASFDRLSTIST